MENTIDRIETSSNIVVYPMDLKVVTEIPVELNIHDGIIVATAITFAKSYLTEVVVITKDN